MVEKRKYSQVETKLINEWLAIEFPGALTWKRVRLGAIPGTPAEKIYKGLRRWADVVLFVKDIVYIVEAKMRPMPEAVAQLEVYDMLFAKTPEFEQLWDKPRELIFLTTKYDETVDALCKKRGIRLTVFERPWVETWWIEKVAKP